MTTNSPTKNLILTLSLRPAQPPQTGGPALLAVAFAPAGLLFIPTHDNTPSWHLWFVIAAAGLTLLIILSAIGLTLFNRRLRTAVAQRTAELESSEQRYRSLFNNILDGILIADDDGRYVDANPAACNMLGYTRDELLTKGIWDISATQDRALLLDAWQAFIAAGSQRGEYLSQGKDGQTIHTEHSSVANFAPGLHLAVFRDITNRKQNEETLRESETRFRILFDLSPDAILLAEVETGILVDANPAAEKLLQKPRHELVGLHHEALYPPDQQAKARQSFTYRPAVPAGPPAVEIDLLTASGERKTVEIRGRKITLAGQEYVYGAFRDVSERKQWAEKLQESEERHRLLFENAPIGIGYYTPEGIIIAFNNQAAALMQGQPEDFPGQSLIELYGPKAGGEYLKRIHAAAQSEHNLTFEDFVTLPSGDKWFNSTYSRHIDPHGRVIGVQIISHDVTEAKQAALKNRALLEALPDQVFLLNRAGDVLDYRANDSHNPALKHLDIIGQNIHQAMPPDFYQTFQKHMERCYQTGQMQRFDFRLSTDRGEQDFEARIVVSGGELMSIVRNITERKTAEAERDALLRQIQDQARLMQEIMDRVPEGLLLVDGHGDLLLTNPIARAHLAFLNGRSTNHYLNQLGDSPLSTFLTPPASGLFHELQKDDKTFEVIAEPFATTAVTGWLLLIRDITQERERQKINQQQERLAAIGQLAAGMAHDFNNILAVIALYTELLLLEPPPHMLPRLEVIQDQTNKAASLIQQILDFGRRAPINRRPIHFQALLQDSVALLARTLPETIAITLAETPGNPIVDADPTRLQQAILNLALNASDAMPQGGRLHLQLSQITVDERQPPAQPGLTPGSWVRLDFSDTGVGISAAHLPRIFEPFFTTKAPKGNGLGLSQVYGIIKQHGGELTVTSTLGAGTKISIYLPALAAAGQTETANESVSAPHGRQQTILVVEDQEEVRTALAEGLKALNYEVITAVNGQEALALYDARPQQIDLVLSDMIMPVMGGETLYYALRERDTTVKFVILTGYSSEEALNEMANDGLIHWLLKPPDLQELAGLLARLLNKG